MVSAKDPRDHASMSQDHQRLFARRRCGNRPPGRWKREGKAKPAIPESAGQPNFDPNPNRENLSTKGKAKATSKPAIAVITGFGVGLSGQEPGNTKRVGSASTCEPYREIIELGLSRHRNAMAIWQDLVSDHGSLQLYSARRPARRTDPAVHRYSARNVFSGSEGPSPYGTRGLKQWLPARTTGYAQLEKAVQRFNFYGSAASTAGN